MGFVTLVLAEIASGAYDANGKRMDRMEAGRNWEVKKEMLKVSFIPQFCFVFDCLHCAST